MRAKKIHYYEVGKMFYDIFTSPETTLDQIKEILDYSAYFDMDYRFNPNPNAMYNTIRLAFLSANDAVNIIERFDDEYREHFFKKMLEVVEFDLAIGYPKEILMRCANKKIEWSMVDKKYFCDKDIQPMIREFAIEQMPHMFDDTDGEYVYYSDKPGKAFWLLVSCGIVFDTEFFRKIVDTKNILFDDYENFVKPIRAYLVEKQQIFVCGNQIPTELCKVLDDLPKDIKVRFLLRDN